MTVFQVEDPSNSSFVFKKKEQTQVSTLHSLQQYQTQGK